jgi:hypothetical protein
VTESSDRGPATDRVACPAEQEEDRTGDGHDDADGHQQGDAGDQTHDEQDDA